MSISAELDKAKIDAGTTRSVRKVDRWLEENPDKLKELEEAGKWFSENRDSDFGWIRFTSVLTEKWEDFPTGYQSVSGWFQSNYPELF